MYDSMGSPGGGFWNIMIDDTGGEGGITITKKVWHNIWTVPYNKSFHLILTALRYWSEPFSSVYAEGAAFAKIKLRFIVVFENSHLVESSKFITCRLLSFDFEYF